MKTILAMLFSSATFFAMAQDTTIIKMEYYIDTDPGFGNATSLNIPSSADVSFPFTVSLAGYSPGYHKLYVRTRDNQGKWSLSARRNIEVLSSSLVNNVVNGEYFIDEDPGFGAAKALIINAAGDEILQDFNAALTGLSADYHKLYGRVKDTHGRWSLTFRRNIELIKDDNAKVINGEYFFKTDNGFGNCTPVVFTMPLADGSFNFNIPAAQIPADADTLFVRVRDDVQNNWSITTVMAVNTVLPLRLLNFTAERKKNSVLLKWQTTNEINTAYFNIQRSVDAVHFTPIGMMSATNVHGLNNYLYEDDLPSVISPTLYYRLQMIDRDGASACSKIEVINIEGEKTKISLYPNPARDQLSISSSMPENLNGSSLTISDVAGRIILTQYLSAVSVQKIDVSKLKKGMYAVRISSSAGIDVFKIIKQ